MAVAIFSTGAIVFWLEEKTGKVESKPIQSAQLLGHADLQEDALSSPLHTTQTQEEYMQIFWVSLCVHGCRSGAISLPKNVCAVLTIGALLVVMVVTLPLTLSVWDLLQTAG